MFLTLPVVLAYSVQACPCSMQKETACRGLRQPLSVCDKSLSLQVFAEHTVEPSFPGGTSGKGPACQCRRHTSCGLHPWVGKTPWRRARQPTPVFLPGESHGQRSLVGCSLWGRKESNVMEMSWQACTIKPGGNNVCPASLGSGQRHPGPYKSLDEPDLGLPSAQPRAVLLPVLPSSAHTPHCGRLARCLLPRLPDSQCRGSPRENNSKAAGSGLGVLKAPGRGTDG